MCGIAGVFGTFGSHHYEDIEEMLALMSHRGPDGRMLSGADWYLLGHNRLAINDLSEAGDQPFTSAAHSLTCIYNGEIYNHASLRKQFGIDVQSNCDGAVLPVLWATLGIGALKTLRGMYSIAVVDLAKRQLTLAVDPFGIKPCYWVRHHGDVFFASESRALARTLKEYGPSTSAIAAFLLTGSVPADASAYDQINRIEPGGWVQFDIDGGVTSGLSLPGLSQTERQASAELARDFDTSVRAHLLADVPVGLLLSSGVDSTAIAVAASHARQNLHCLTVDFGRTGVGEGTAAGAAASELGVRHSLVRAEPTCADVEGFFAAMDRPTIDGLNTYLVCKAVAELGLKVVLSGAGGDEILGGGYRHHQLRWLVSAGPSPVLAKAGTTLAGLASRIPGFADKAVSGLMSVGWPTDCDSLIAFARTIRHDRATTESILALNPHHRFYNSAVRALGDQSSRTRLLWAETEQYLISQLLPDADAFSMAHSVELRVPFVDVLFADASWTTPVSRNPKASFARSFGSPLVTRAAQRAKQGFEIPMDRWMRVGPLEPRLRQAEGSNSAVGSLIGAAAVKRTVTRWRSGRAHWSTAWSLAVADSWMRSH